MILTPRRKSVGTLLVLVGLNSLLSYLRDAAVASHFGASKVSDAFFVGTFLPTLLYVVVVTGSLAPTLLPIFTESAGHAGSLHAQRLLASISRWLAVALVAVVLCGEASAPWLVRLIAPGFDEETAALTVTLLRLSLPMLLFLGPAAVAGVALHYRQNFAMPALGALAYSAVVLGGAWLAGTLGVWVIALAMVAGAALQLAVHLPALEPPVRKAVLLLAPGGDRAGVRRVARLAGPLLLFMVLAQSVPLLERFVASSLPAGELSRLAFASKLNGLVAVVLASSFVTVMFPSLSRDALHVDGQAFAKTLQDGLAALAFVTLPLSAWLIACAPLLVAVVFQRGSFSAADAQATAHLLSILAWGIAPASLGVLLTRAFHARQDTRTPLAIGVVNTALYIVLGVTLTRQWQTAGLATAYVVSSYTGLAMLLLGLAWRHHAVRLPVLPGALLSGVLTAALSGLASWGLLYALRDTAYAQTFWTQLGALALLAATGATLYLGAGFLLGAWRWRRMPAARAGEIERVELHE